MGPAGKIQGSIVDVGQGAGGISHLHVVFILVLLCPWISRGLLPTVSLEAPGGQEAMLEKVGGCAKTPSILLILGNKPQVLRLFCFTAWFQQVQVAGTWQQGCWQGMDGWGLFHPLSLQDCDVSPVILL